MDTNQAINITKLHLKWMATGSHILYGELNSKLLKEALEYLVVLAQETLQDGLGNK